MDNPPSRFVCLLACLAACYHRVLDWFSFGDFGKLCVCLCVVIYSRIPLILASPSPTQREKREESPASKATKTPRRIYVQHTYTSSHKEMCTVAARQKNKPYSSLSLLESRAGKAITHSQQHTYMHTYFHTYVRTSNMQQQISKTKPYNLYERRAGRAKTHTQEHTYVHTYTYVRTSHV